MHWLFSPATVFSDLGSDPVSTTHHYLVLAASVFSDLLDKIIIEINGVVVNTSTDVYSCSSRHFARSGSRQSSPLISWVMHFSFLDKNFSF